MKKTRKYIMYLTVLLSLFIICACGREEEEKENMTGQDTSREMFLSLQEDETELIMENEKIRLILNADTGAVVELYNKQSGLYLTRDTADVLPLRLQTAVNSITNYKDFSYEIVEDSEQEKRLAFTWNFENGACVESQVFLQKGADEVDFRLTLKANDADKSLISIEYPIIENITTLSDPETDYFASPFVMGVLFQNPVEAFNSEDFYGISKDNGIYPSGWEYPMQFSSYYSKGAGGFYWQTRDGGDTIKSFTMTGNDGALRLSIYHFLDDIAADEVEFDYDICFANMTEGSWYEAANKYRDWAAEQSWAVETGKLAERKDEIDLELYENTVLTIFGYRVHEETWEDYADIYDILKSRIDGKFLNVAIYRNNTYLEKINQYDDLLNNFEFNTLQLIAYAEDTYDFYSSAMMDALGAKETYQNYYHECASDATWRKQMLLRNEAYIENYDVDGFYYDVDIAAVHPKQCFDTSHAHGTRVNVIRDFLDQIQASKNLQKDKILSIGTELMFEQMLPYVDYYQARSGGWELGWMEHDRVRALLENGTAEIIPMFDYVYHEYGELRTDGYLTTDEELGESFYYAAAYVALNGGIPEFNYEFYLPDDLPSVEELYLPYIDFINTLGKVRTGFGKDFLVYGRMMPAPEVDAGTSVYEYENKNNDMTINSRELAGTAEWDNIVVSAYEYDGEIAIFLCNASAEKRKVSFELDAQKDYGITEGKITGITEGETFEVGKVKDGAAEVSLEIEAKEIVMLTISGN